MHNFMVMYNVTDVLIKRYTSNFEVRVIITMTRQLHSNASYYICLNFPVYYLPSIIYFVVGVEQVSGILFWG